MDSMIYSDVKKRIHKGLLRNKKKMVLTDEVSVYELNAIVQTVLDENPDIFYVNEWDYEFLQTGINLYPHYLYSRREIKDISNRCDEQIEIIISRIKNMNSSQILKRLHDILINNITYDLGSDYELHTIVGPLLNRKAVCDGFAKLYKYILDKVGIRCILIRGRGINSTQIDLEEHTWNMVEVDGSWFHVDTTFDATLSLPDYIRYDYFMVDDTIIKIDHYFNYNIAYRANNQKYCYYENNNCDIKNKNELRQYIKGKVYSGEDDFIVKLPIELETSKAELIILQTVSQFMEELDIHKNIYMSINSSRNIFLVRLTWFI